MTVQQELWHDSFEDALKSVSEAVGPKKLAQELWPERDPIDGAKLLARCLDIDRSEKLTASQEALILKRGREVGCHIGMAFLAQMCGYAAPQPVDPEDEKARLQREYIEAVKRMEQIAKGMEALNGS